MKSDTSTLSPSKSLKKLRKILIEADSAIPEPHALAFATQMAGPIGARLAGCFVENQALIDLANLPFASEVSFSGTVRPLERERLIKQWHGQAVQAETAFAAAASAAGLDWSFEVRRGKPLFSLLEGAEREDVVVLHTTSRLTAPGDVARAARAATSDMHADVLLTGEGRARGALDTADTLVVLDDMTSRGEACCHAAKVLAKKAGMNCIAVSTRKSEVLNIAAQVRQMLPVLIIADMHSALFAKDEDATRFSVAVGCPTLFFGSERAATEDDNEVLG